MLDVTGGLRNPALPGLADALWRAEAERAPIDPLTDSQPDLSIDEAYEIQARNAQRRVADGGQVIGRKVGLTSRRTQQLFGVHEPTCRAGVGGLAAEPAVLILALQRRRAWPRPVGEGERPH